MGVALLAVGVGALIATAFLALSTLRLASPIAFALGVYVVATAEVVLLSLLLSPLRLVSAPGYLGAQAVALAIVAYAWHRGGRPLPRVPRLDLVSLRRHRILTTLVVAVVAATAYALVIGVVVPPNNSDSMTYRLSRAVAWLQHGGLYWIPDAHTERQNEFPANSELQILYTFALTRGDRFAALTQLVAGVVAVVAVAGMARRLGYGRPASAFAAALTATLSAVALQTTSTQNDLVVAAGVGAAAYFVRSPRPAELALGGVALGLALGTKPTPYLVLPSLALLAAASLPRRRLVHAFTAAAGGAILFAGYTVVLDVAHTGKPLGHAREQAVYRPWVTARGTASTVSRIVYRFADFSGLPVRQSWLAPVESASERAFDVLGIPPNPRESSGSLFTFELNLRAHEDHSFFGPLGIVLVVPLAAAFALSWPMRRTTAAHAAHALALPVFVVLLALVFRFSDEGRYLIAPVVLTMPLAAALYRRRVVATALAAVGVLTLAAAHLQNELKPTGIHGKALAWELTRAEAQSLDVPAREPLVAAVTARVPEDAEVAGALSQYDWDYPLFGRSFRRRLVSVSNTCPVQGAERHGVRFLVLGALLDWPGLHPGWDVDRFPGAGTLLVREREPATRSPRRCYAYAPGSR